MLMDEVQRGGFQTGEAKNRADCRSFVCGSGYFSASPVCAMRSSAAPPGCQAHAPPCQSTRPPRHRASSRGCGTPYSPARVNDHAVPAGHDETEKRRLQLRIGQIVRRNVSPDVMHPARAAREASAASFAKFHPNEHRADQPRRRIRHGHGVDVPARELCLLQRLIREAVDRLDVLARRDLRHHAATLCSSTCEEMQSVSTSRRARWQPPFRRRKIRLPECSCRQVFERYASSFGWK